jgi:asparagine synthase (glutamine-hydrolysing)
LSGFCGFTGELNDEGVALSAMMGKLTHRGPDYTLDFQNAELSLGLCGMGSEYAKFEIESLYDEKNMLVLAFDGDISNYSELKKILASLNRNPANISESALISELYAEYGTDMLSILHGSFSFVIADLKNKSLFAARDRFGVKPFFYSFQEGKLIFASELKSLLEYSGLEPKLNKEALEQYLSFQYSVLDETFFSDTYRLMPGHCLYFADGNLEIEQYYSFKFESKEQSFDDAVSRIESAVLGALEPYKEKDLEIASFLSAGVDSSFIAAAAEPRLCFTVGYDDYSDQSYSEIEYAQEFAEEFKIQHEVKYISPDEYFKALPRAMYYMDEPLADPASIAFYLGCEHAATQVKMSFSGEGPDEFFGGYGIYSEPFALGKLKLIPLPIRRCLSKALSVLPFSVKGMGYLICAGKPVEERFIGNAHIFTVAERKALLKSSGSSSPFDLTQRFYGRVKDLDDSTKMQYIDINFWLHGDILHQADRMSMAHSLSLKTPYINEELADVAASLPTKYRVSPAGDKIAFRAAAMRHLPESFARREKKAFPVPLKNWLVKDEYYHYVLTYFQGETAQKYFNAPMLEKLLNDHREKRAENSRKIWTILTFLIWHEQYFKKAAD